MLILSIETSCDETALSYIEATGPAEAPVFEVLGNALYSQVAAHAEFGGVMPSLAKREHCKNIVPLFSSATKEAMEKGRKTDDLALSAEDEKAIRAVLEKEMDLADRLITMLRETEVVIPDCVAVTVGPGLEPALWVGINFARALSIAFEKPIVPVNHMEGHMVSVLMDRSHDDKALMEFPALALLISGGHTELIEATAWHDYRVIGQTKDDAIGEAFDKVARLIGLPYPGGPKISMLAAESRRENLMARMTETEGARPWTLPRPMLKSPDFHFSFSGIKTSVLYAVQQKTGAGSNGVQGKEATRTLTDNEKKTLAEEFENAVTEVLVSKTKRAIRETGARTLITGGGVIANTYIRESFKAMIEDSFGPESGQPVTLFIPSTGMSTDNSIMIGAAGYLRWLHAGKNPDSDLLHLPGSDGHATMSARGNLSL